MMNTIEKALQKQQQMQSKKPVLDGAMLDQAAQTKQHEDPPTVPIGQPEQTDSHHTLHTAPVEQRNAADAQMAPEHDGVSHATVAEKPARKSKRVELDIDYLSSMGFLVPNSANTIMNEEYRQIKRPLIRNIQGKSAHPIDNANIIQVTSSLSGEGKTFTAINLALAFAMELDYNVLLVDADTIKSSITRTLLNETFIGLTDYLSGEVDDVSDVMLATNIEKLRILPAGSRHLLSTELLNSQYMGKLIEEFSHRYANRVVIFDSPPLLQTNDARILSHRVGQLVFVVEQNKTPQAVVKSAVELLDPDMVVGVVMNKTRSTVQGGYYGYYGYGA